jgi:hypothetical protein
MQTRHEYAAAHNLTIIKDSASEFWALCLTSGNGFNIIDGCADGSYCAIRHDSNNHNCGTAGHGDTMDAAVAAMTAA